MSEINPSELLSQLRAMASTAAGGPPSPSAGADQPDFGHLLEKAVDRVNESQQHVSGLKKDFQLGKDGVDIAEVMIASQKANIEFQMMMNVRNKLINAYKDVMNMQI